MHVVINIEFQFTNFLHISTFGAFLVDRDSSGFKPPACAIQLSILNAIM